MDLWEKHGTELPTDLRELAKLANVPWEYIQSDLDSGTSEDELRESLTGRAKAEILIGKDVVPKFGIRHDGGPFHGQRMPENQAGYDLYADVVEACRAVMQTGPLTKRGRLPYCSALSQLCGMPIHATDRAIALRIIREKEAQ